MKNISDIDTNLKPVAVAQGLRFYDVRKAPFTLHGLYKPEEPGLFRRCPEEVAKATSAGVEFLHTNTVGGRVRFRTNSKIVAMRCELPTVCVMPHQALAGSSCFDLYADGEYYRTFLPTIDYQGGFMPHFNMDGGYEAQLELPDRKSRNMMLHFPTYNDVTNLYIGIEEGAELTFADEYTIQKPILFYGSSITHGCAANKPGDAYPSILSRWLDADIVNLAFSGNCKAEDAMADWIAGQDMSVFVFDYDHNAPSAEHLRNTHEKLFKKVRAKHPNLPVVFASAPDHFVSEKAERKQIILDTYNHAKAAGDGNVYFVDGEPMFDLLDYSLCTADGCHPTTLGFYCMARAFLPVLEKILYPRGR